MPGIKLRVKEHYGDEECVFNLPKGWELSYFKMNNHESPALTRKGIDDALDHPVGTKSLTELAKGKKGRIVILHDDLTRPTPAYDVIPSIISKLHEAGIKDDQIFFLAAIGTHPPMSVDAIGRKIGYNTIQRYQIRNHVVFNTKNFGTYNFVERGFTSFGTPVTINSSFGKADLRIAVSGLIKKALGCGGGGKMCLPGIASMEAIAYNHTVLLGRLKDNTIGFWKIKNNLTRYDMQEFARKSGLDFMVNVVPNGKREIDQVIAGDIDEAWLKGVKSCYKSHSTQIPNKKFDVIIACGYPQAGPEGLRWCDGAEDILREGGTAININLSSPEGYYLTHYLDEAVRGKLLRFTLRDRDNRWPIRKAGHIIVFDNLCDLSANSGKLQYDERLEWFNNWDSVHKRLEDIHGSDASVAIFPTAAFQFVPEKFPLQI
jgi:nickel-dependent lactate racemase